MIVLLLESQSTHELVLFLCSWCSTVSAMKRQSYRLLIVVKMQRTVLIFFSLLTVTVKILQLPVYGCVSSYDALLLHCWQILDNSHYFCWCSSLEEKPKANHLVVKNKWLKGGKVCFNCIWIRWQAKLPGLKKWSQCRSVLNLHSCKCLQGVTPVAARILWRILRKRRCYLSSIPSINSYLIIVWCQSLVSFYKFCYPLELKRTTKQSSPWSRSASLLPNCYCEHPVSKHKDGDRRRTAGVNYTQWVAW